MGYSSASSSMALMWYGVRGHRVRGHGVKGSWGHCPGVTGLYRTMGSCAGIGVGAWPGIGGRGLGVVGGALEVAYDVWAWPEGCGRGFGFGAISEW